LKKLMVLVLVLSMIIGASFVAAENFTGCNNTGNPKTWYANNVGECKADVQAICPGTEYEDHCQATWGYADLECSLLKCENKCDKANGECHLQCPGDYSIFGCISPQVCCLPTTTPQASEFSTISGVIVILVVLAIAFLLIRKKQ